MRAPRLTGSRCLCRACGERFNSTAAFDRHRVDVFSGSRRCLTSEEITRRGMTRNAAGFWITKERYKHRVKPVPSRIPAALRETPVVTKGAGRESQRSSG
jgi:hypothetical protein